MKVHPFNVKFVMIIACMAIATCEIQAAEGTKNADPARLIVALQNNDFDRAVIIASQVIQTIGPAKLLDIMERHINFENEATSKFFDWFMARKHALEQQRHEIPAAAPAPSTLGVTTALPKAPVQGELSQFGQMTFAVPALTEEIARTIATEWLNRNPAARYADLVNYYRTTSGGYTFAPPMLHEIYRLLQDLRRQFIFFVNNTDRAMVIRIGIDPNQMHANPPRSLAESVAQFEQPEPVVAEVNQIPAAGIIRLPWDAVRLGHTSYVSTATLQERIWAKRGLFERLTPFQVGPGDIVYLDEEGHIFHIDRQR